MRRASLIVASLGLACLAGCVGPARTDRVYEGKAVETAKAVRSAAESARLAAIAATRGNATGQYSSVVLGDAEDDAGAAVGAFDSIQPPSTVSDALHDRLSPLFTSVTDILRELRIEARRTDLSRLARIAAGLDPIVRKLAAFVEARE